MSGSAEGLQEIVNQMLQDVNSLLPEILSEIKLTDKKKTASKSAATKRHRLILLHEAAEHTRDKLPKSIVNPWFLAELRTTIDVIQKWRNDPIWMEIEPSLVNSSDFTHTIATLQLAEHLRRSGHKTEIVHVSGTPTPDLKVKAIGGTQEWVNVECYQPAALDGRGTDLTEKQIKSIIKKAKNKVKKQIRKELGILAICGYNQPKVNTHRLREAFEDWFQKTSRVNLCGVVMEMLGVLVIKTDDGYSFQPTISIDYIENPNYFGIVDIVSESQEDDPRLIHEPYFEIDTRDLVSGRFTPTTPANIPETKTRAQTSASYLELIDRPVKDRVVFVAKSNELQCFFRGRGNINYYCGSCRRLLAEKVWRLSLNNLVVRCPRCGSYNDIPPVDNPPNIKLAKCVFAQGEYDMNHFTEIKRGFQLIGVKINEEILHEWVKEKDVQTRSS